MKHLSSFALLLALGAGVTGCSREEDDTTARVATTSGDEASPCETPEVYFASDSAELTEDSKHRLHELAQCVQDEDIDAISLVGHTDPSGPADHNAELGMARAEAVMTFLASCGVDEPIISRSEGEEESSRVRLLWPLDRRVDIEAVN